MQENQQKVSREKIHSYFEKLGELYQTIEVTQLTGNPLAFGEAVDQMIQTAIKTHKQNQKLIFIGNGGSSAIASHMAIDYWKNGGIRATAFNDPALLTCLSNDYGYEYVFQKPIEMLSQPGDLLIAISSSGCSPNILNGVKMARQKNCAIITLSGFKADNPLRTLGDLNFYVPSQAYGFVEMTHLAICHAALDLACELQQEIR